MFKWIKNYLLYAKVDPVELAKVNDAVSENNKKSLGAYALMGVAFFTIMFIISAVSAVASLNSNVIAYSSAALLCAGIFVATRFVTKKSPKTVLFLMYLFNSVLLAFGLYIAFITSPDRITVSLLVMQMLTPLIFTDRPYRAFICAAVLDLVFIHLAIQFKPADILVLDILDVVLYGFIGLVVGSYMSRMKFERFVLENKVAELNGDDELNHYIQSMADIYITVVQIDVKTGAFRAIINKTNMVEFDAHEDFGKQLRLAMNDAIDESCRDAILPYCDIAAVAKSLKGKRTVTQEFFGKRLGWCRGRYVAIGPISKDRAPEQLIFAIENINEQKNKENELITAAETDLMTGLYNRVGGVNKIKQALLANKPGMLCLFDIDNFKSVNDNYGHQVGDKVIIAVAEAMQTTFRDEDILLRLGGDEYVAFLNKVGSEEQGMLAIGRLFAEIERILIDEIPDYKISVSLGASFFRKDSNIDFDTLYKQADDCTYQSKKVEGKSFTFYREISRDFDSRLMNA